MNHPTRITIEHDPGSLGAYKVADGDPACAEPHRASAFDLVAAQPWAIQPETLATIAAIARREGEGAEAVEARLGRPLQNARSVSMRDGVAVVPVTGPVFRYANLFTEVSGATSLEMLARDFTTANDDPAVSAIVLNIDSPGGQANGIAEFATMVNRASKRVVAYVDGNAASAAYWIAAAADEIVIGKTGMVGSIGAVLSIDPARSKKGVLEIVSAQSPKKRPDVATEEGRAQLQAMVDKLAQVFVEDVAAYRGVGVETVLADFGQGDMRLGAEAVGLGMADRVGTLEDLIAELAAMHNASPAHPPKRTATMNLEELRAAHPDLCAALIAEGRALGAADELARVLAVQAQSYPGHEKLIAQFVADGKTTGPEAAVAILSAERATNAGRLDALRAEAPAPVPHAAAPDAQPAAADESLPIEDRCKAAWDKSADLRTEFAGNYAAYVAYTRANEAGRVKQLSR